MAKTTHVYRFVGPTPQDFATLGRILSPGDTLTSPRKLNHPHLEEQVPQAAPARSPETTQENS